MTRGSITQLRSLRPAFVRTNMRGGDRIDATGPDSQWIVAAGPLCPLQSPVAYLSRLKRFLPAARWELRFKASRKVHPPNGIRRRHVPLGGRGPLLLVGKQTAGPGIALARILTWERSVIIQRTVASRHWLFNQAR